MAKCQANGHRGAATGKRGVTMRYGHHDIRAALAAAKASGRDTKGMHADDRQTVLALER